MCDGKKHDPPALRRGVELGYYDLRAFVVMGSHHWVREERQLERIAAYIENNPAQTGVAPDPSQYRWSSAWEGGELKFAAAR